MNRVGLIMKGMMMGVAEVIPGVSGGTIAFITGIYERLLNSIKSVRPSLIGDYKKGGFKELWRVIDMGFLITLLAGMVLGIGIGVVFISYLLEHYPEPLWAFFFGLILASCIYIGKKVTSWNLGSIALLVVGFIIAFGITMIAPSEGSVNPLMVFCAGAIAISALILPGVSGSFILLLMGMYTVIFGTLKDFFSSPSFDEFKVLLFFGLGALTGLAVFSRVLSWTFKNYHNQTLALLTGFMLGSLNKIWPWRNPDVILDKESGELISTGVIERLTSLPDHDFKILKELKVLPEDYLMAEPKVAMVTWMFVLGLVLVFGLSRLEK